MNKKGQAESIVIFFIVVVAIFMASIIILRITNSVITPFATAINNTHIQGSEKASETVIGVRDKFTGVWDWAIVILFLINIMILLLSAFLIDIHPAFVVIYIFAGIFLFIFGNFVLGALDSIWGAVGTATETAQTPLQQFILNNFQMIFLGIYVLSGIVMYAKIKFFGGGNY